MAIVVSEETGLVSFVRGGRIKRALDATRLRAAIYQAVEGGHLSRDLSLTRSESERRAET